MEDGRIVDGSGVPGEFIVERKTRIPGSLVEDIRRFVLNAVQLLVDNPDRVAVNVVPGEYRVVYELHTDPRDVGQVIGRNAHLISSLRSFVAAFAGRLGMRIDLDFITEHDNARTRRTGTRS